MGVSAETIVELYRACWQVELFIRWMKQHLNVNHLFGTTMNVVLGSFWVLASLLSCCIGFTMRENLQDFTTSQCWFSPGLWNLQLPAEWGLLLFERL
ncbi:transposase [Kroppenstedtia eburnea]|uniref:transposase n=1 Tax=Kroppenstedtia eburnea TaxID=714067 RepID=UPI00362FDDDB